jgi:hypothetical protein
MALLSTSAGVQGAQVAAHNIRWATAVTQRQPGLGSAPSSNAAALGPTAASTRKYYTACLCLCSTLQQHLHDICQT